jgi:acetoin:2,6-dichlorophenolindophenol oxidoreductase subunit beta
MKTAIRDNNPVVIFEDKLMYQDKAPVPEEEYLIPFGKANIKREGRDITFVATSSMVQVAEKAAAILEREGISAEVIDPRTIVPLDEETILASVRKTAAPSSSTRGTRATASPPRSPPDQREGVLPPRRTGAADGRDGRADPVLARARGPDRADARSVADRARLSVRGELGHAA